MNIWRKCLRCGTWPERECMCEGGFVDLDAVLARLARVEARLADIAPDLTPARREYTPGDPSPARLGEGAP